MRQIIKSQAMGFQLETENPFIITMHHKDNYPAGNAEYGPVSGMANRNIGNDFSDQAGYSMYHGRKVPGFPVHPHRGFETVTVVLEGLIDHSDSLGAAGRYGDGDVQWMTAGKGCQHAEMFPLVNKDKSNPLELFQIWLNLPAAKKFVEPDYKMLWHEEIPVFDMENQGDGKVNVRLISGEFDGKKSLTPAKDSYASDSDSHVKIILFTMDANTQLILPKTLKEVNRNLYYYRGKGQLKIEGQAFTEKTHIKCQADEDIIIDNQGETAYLLLLEGKPIDEPIVAYGPFVMNTMEEIRTAYADYQATEFGGWPWDRYDPVHEKEGIRFARYADGREEWRDR